MVEYVAVQISRWGLRLKPSGYIECGQVVKVLLQLSLNFRQNKHSWLDVIAAYSSAWIRMKRSHLLSNAIFSLAFFLSFFLSFFKKIIFFFLPWSTGDERLQRQLQNKGSLFLWVDVRPSQHEVLFEERQNRPSSVSLCVFPLSRPFTETKLVRRQYDDLSSAVYTRAVLNFSHACLCTYFLTCPPWLLQPPVCPGLSAECLCICMWAPERP